VGLGFAALTALFSPVIMAVFIPQHSTDLSR